MSGRLIKVGIVASLAAGVFGLSPFTAGAEQAAPIEATPQQADNGQLCEQSRDYLLLIDMSGSLQKTDKNNKRIEGAKELVAGLASNGSDATLSIAGFGSTVTEPKSFELPEEQEAARNNIDEFTDKKSDKNTDYVLAMLESVDHFKGRGTPKNCSTLFWFTDGAHDIEDASEDFVGSYTNLRSGDEAKILEGFEGAVCGPVPERFTLRAPLHEELAGIDLQIKLIDLYDESTTTDNQKEKRAETDIVTDQLGDPDSECAVDFKRIRVEEADGLPDAFETEALEIFEQEEIEAGRSEVDCSILDNGVPATVVESISARADRSTTSLNLKVGNTTKTVEGRVLKAWSPEDSAKERAGQVSIKAVGGSLESCFAQTAAVIEVLEGASLYAGDNSSPVYFAVGKQGISGFPLAGVGDTNVSLTATVDGVNVEPAWDPDLTKWRVDIPRPVGSEVQLRIDGVLKGLDGKITPLDTPIPVKDVPAVPAVVWRGDSKIEGKKSVDGDLAVQPSAQTGRVCIDVDLPAPLETEDGKKLGTFEQQPAEGLQPSQKCAPADEVLNIPVTLVILEETNAVGNPKIRFTAVYETPKGELKPMGEGPVDDLEFTLTKPVDSAKQLWLSLALAAASAVLTYLLMMVLTAAQSKLRPSSQMLAIRTALVLDAKTGRLTRADPASPISLMDFKQVSGSSTRYDLGQGLTVARRIRANPFGTMSAKVDSDTFPVLAHPALGPSTRNGRTVPVPLRFGALVVVVPTAPSPHAVALVPIGTTPTDASRLIENSILKLDRQIGELAPGSGSDGGDQGPPSGPPSSTPQGSGDGGPQSLQQPPTDAPSSGPTKSDRKPPPPPHRR